MVKVSAHTPLLICCYFPCTRHSDMGNSKNERQFCNCPVAKLAVLSVWQEYEWQGVFVLEPLSFLLLSALCPATRFPRHSSVSQHSAILGSKFTCQAEKTTYWPHFYRSPLSSTIFYPLLCNLSSLEHVVNLTYSLGEAQLGNRAL